MWTLIYIISGIAACGLFGLVVMGFKMEMELKAVDNYIKSMEVEK